MRFTPPSGENKGGQAIAKYSLMLSKGSRKYTSRCVTWSVYQCALATSLPCASADLPSPSGSPARSVPRKPAKDEKRKRHAHPYSSGFTDVNCFCSGSCTRRTVRVLSLSLSRLYTLLVFSCMYIYIARVYTYTRAVPLCFL